MLKKFAFGRLVALVCMVVICCTLAAPQAQAKGKLQVDHTSDALSAQVDFKWNTYTAAAAFIDNNRIWFIFDNPSPEIYIPDLRHEKIEITDFKYHFDDKKSTIISAKIKYLDNINKPNLLFYRAGFSWKLRISSSAVKPKEMRVISKPFAAPQPRIEIEFNDTTLQPINFFNYDTGILYSAIPSNDSGVAILRDYGFIDLDILKSLQGVVIRPKSDSLKVTLEEQIIRIEGAASLNIAPRIFNKKHDKYEDRFVKLNLGEYVEGYASILSLKSFETNDESYNYKIRKILHFISHAEDAKKKAHIYANLALFYIANGLYKEALVIMKLIAELDEEFYNSYNIRLMHASIHYLSSEFGRAYDIVRKIKIADVPINLRKEVRFWKAITSFMVSEKSLEFSKSIDPVEIISERDINFLSEYGQKLFFEVVMATILEKLKTNDLSKIKSLLNYIENLEITDRDLNRLNSVKARFFKAANKEDLAMQHWDMCIENIEDHLNYTICRYDRAKYLLENDKIKAPKYINELETLSYLWHGDELQVDMLKDLGNMYHKHGNYTKALRSWNKIVESFSFSPDALSLSKIMGETFVKFFIDPNFATNISHLDALTLFYEFEYLVPIGDLGDEVVLKFVDHLVALDLLDRAIVILKHQINNRLHGYKKEEMINRLAEIYLDNMEPGYALDILNIGDDYKILPDYIGKPRKYIKAKVLHFNKKNKQAMQLLENDYSSQADEIKAMIYWNQKDWKKFTEYIEPRVYKIRYNNKTISNADAESVLKLAIAYLINNEWKLLGNLYDDFKNRMPAGNRNTKIFLTLEQSWHSIKDSTIEADKTIKMIQDVVSNIVSAINEEKPAD